MEIKRTSWHYKISNCGGFEKLNDNLCCYFWRLVGKLILFLAAAIVVFFFLYAFFTGDFIFNVLTFLFICSLFVLPSLAIDFIRKKLGKSPEMPYGNIVVEYAAAKKKKICPLITYIS